ncbi:hypothetical protein M1O56_05945 [Dehalococcoidia bacterium]|nr:hypothetical protein [Dehalococcoidia bacterium]
MRKAKILAAIVGVISGLLWFLSALHFPPQYYPLGLGPLPPQILPLGILLSLMGIVVGILALGRPAVGGTLMLASAVGGFFGPFALAWFFWEDVWRGIALSTVMEPFPGFPVLIVGVSGALLLVTWNKPSRARVATLVLGVVAGFISAEVARSATAHIGEEFMALGFLFSFMGIAGGLLAPAKPRVAWMLMLVSGIGCFLTPVALIVFEGPGCWPEASFFLAYILAGLLFTIGGILALVAHR